jgi:hypothetical protein
MKIASSKMALLNLYYSGKKLMRMRDLFIRICIGSSISLL